MAWTQLATVDPRIAMILGALGMLLAMTLLRLLRSVRRLFWTATVLATAGSMGAGSGWVMLDALRLWH